MRRKDKEATAYIMVFTVKTEETFFVRTSPASSIANPGTIKIMSITENSRKNVSIIYLKSASDIEYNP